MHLNSAFNFFKYHGSFYGIKGPKTIQNFKSETELHKQIKEPGEVKQQNKVT